MEITITINGKPVQATVDDAVIREAMSEKASEKMTGYERHEHGLYYYQTTDGYVIRDDDIDSPVDLKRYQAGNYYSSEKVAKANARADSLMRNLRRFAAEHSGCGKPALNISPICNAPDWTITFFQGEISAIKCRPTAGTICFKTQADVHAAIVAFRDELTWYFTEYDPMPEGWWDS